MDHRAGHRCPPKVNEPLNGQAGCHGPRAIWRAPGRLSSGAQSRRGELRAAIRVNNLGSVLRDQGDLAGARAAFVRSRFWSACSGRIIRTRAPCAPSWRASAPAPGRPAKARPDPAGRRRPGSVRYDRRKPRVSSGTAGPQLTTCIEALPAPTIPSPVKPPAPPAGFSAAARIPRVAWTIEQGTIRRRRLTNR
jgi:hypothetical protein